MDGEEGKEGESSKRAVGGRNRGKLRNNAQIFRSRKRTKEGKLRKKGREPGGSQKHDKLLSYSLWRLKDINTCTDVRFLKPLKPLLSVTLSSKRKNSLRASSPILACEAQTHSRSPLLSPRWERSDDRKCVCASQAILFGRTERAWRERITKQRSCEGTPAFASPLACPLRVYFP